jgi:hypothetical protein
MESPDGFPLKDVHIRQLPVTRKVTEPVYADETWRLNQNEFSMEVEGVGTFYATGGTEVEYTPVNGASKTSVRLYLNGSVYGAILHQRNILPLHASSFSWQGRGIVICGGSGAGKSTLTAAFCFDGAEFLTDDVTPVIFDHGRPEILPLSDRIKLWKDSLPELNLKNKKLVRLPASKGKYYVPIKRSHRQKCPVDRIFIVESSETDNVETHELKGVELFTALRNEVYRWQYLAAMPATEASCLGQLLAIARTTPVTRIRRPAGVSIEVMKAILSRHF